MKIFKKKSKGELTINGIIAILMGIIVLAITLPMQVSYIQSAKNATGNSTMESLILDAVIPFELLMLLSSIVSAGRTARDQFDNWRY